MQKESQKSMKEMQESKETKVQGTANKNMMEAQKKTMQPIESPEKRMLQWIQEPRASSNVCEVTIISHDMQGEVTMPDAPYDLENHDDYDPANSPFWPKTSARVQDLNPPCSSLWLH